MISKPFVSTLLLAAALLATACGPEPIGAVVASGDVAVTAIGGEPVRRGPGPVPFGRGATARVADAPTVLRIAVGSELSAASSASGPPPRGTMDVALAEGTALRRRDGTVFDLLDGSVVVDTGPLARRVVIFRGDVFLEMHDTADANSDGVRLMATAGDGTLSVRVERGEVLLHTPVATPRDLHYVKLEPGESATAREGEQPEKDASPDDSD